MFTKQPEGVKAYEKHGLQYPYEQFDRNHELMMEQTAKSPSMLNFCIITKLIRVRSNYINPDDNKDLDDDDKEQLLEGIKPREYLVWHLMYRRTDSLNNQHHSYRPNLGIIPKLQSTTRIVQDKAGWEEKKVVRADVVGKAYTTLFTGPESVKKLIKEIGEGSLRDLTTEEGRSKAVKDQLKREKWAAEHNKVVYQPQEGEYTHFYIKQEGDQRSYTVSSFDDFCNADFDDIMKFGHIPTDTERENRLAADEVAKAQRLAGSADANLADELDKARERQRSGVPYK